MSEKGVLSKSIANNISEAIIDKLGGTGYAPAEWSKNINLLGIASEDIEEALASITEDASSSDKGLLSLSIASDIGAILNKKYNTSRGFKPNEVSSAVSALIPLPEKTASGSIVTFSDGADDVPTKSLVVTIPPTLSGVSEVTATQTGRNLFDKNAVEDNTRIVANDTTTESAVGFRTSGYIPVKANTRYYISTKSSNRSAYYDRNKNGIAYFSFSGGASFTCLYDGYIRITINNNIDLDTFIVNEGNEAITYEPFGTVYTASLGRTIYGGQVDIVNGTGTETWEKKVYTGAENEYWVLSKSGDVYRYYVINDNVKQPTGRGVVYSSIGQYSASGNEVGTCFSYYSSGIGRVLIYYIPPQTIQTVEDFRVWLQSNNFDVVYEKATPEDFTFDGQEVPTRLGYNAFWSDSGDTEVTYRADLDLYEAPSMLLEANNTETEGNEEQEGNE